MDPNTSVSGPDDDGGYVSQVTDPVSSSLIQQVFSTFEWPPASRSGDHPTDSKLSRSIGLVSSTNPDQDWPDTKVQLPTLRTATPTENTVGYGTGSRDTATQLATRSISQAGLGSDRVDKEPEASNWSHLRACWKRYSLEKASHEEALQIQLKKSIPNNASPEDLRSIQNVIDEKRVHLATGRYREGLVTILVAPEKQKYHVPTVPLLETSNTARAILNNPSLDASIDTAFMVLPKVKIVTFDLFMNWLMDMSNSFMPEEEYPAVGNATINEHILLDLYELGIYLQSRELCQTAIGVLIDRYIAQGASLPASIINRSFEASLSDLWLPIRDLCVDLVARSKDKSELAHVTNHVFFHLYFYLNREGSKALGTGTMPLNQVKKEVNILFDKHAANWTTSSPYRGIKRRFGGTGLGNPEPRDLLARHALVSDISGNGSGPLSAKHFKRPKLSTDCSKCDGKGTTPMGRFICRQCGGSGESQKTPVIPPYLLSQEQKEKRYRAIPLMRANPTSLSVRKDSREIFDNEDEDSSNGGDDDSGEDEGRRRELAGSKETKVKREAA